MSSAVLQSHKCSEEIWKGDEQLDRINKRKLEIRCPRRKQAQEREGEKDASEQSQHCPDRYL